MIIFDLGAIFRKTAIQTAKTKSFPDQLLETQRGITEVDTQIGEAASKMLKKSIGNTVETSKIKSVLMETKIVPETIIKEMTSKIVGRTQAK